MLPPLGSGLNALPKDQLGTAKTHSNDNKGDQPVGHVKRGDRHQHADNKALAKIFVAIAAVMCGMPCRL